MRLPLAASPSLPRYPTFLPGRGPKGTFLRSPWRDPANQHPTAEASGCSKKNSEVILDSQESGQDGPRLGTSLPHCPGAGAAREPVCGPGGRGCGCMAAGCPAAMPGSHPFAKGRLPSASGHKPGLWPASFPLRGPQTRSGVAVCCASGHIRATCPPDRTERGRFRADTGRGEREASQGRPNGAGSEEQQTR